MSTTLTATKCNFGDEHFQHVSLVLQVVLSL